jgi:hypothetical protein
MLGCVRMILLYQVCFEQAFGPLSGDCFNTGLFSGSAYSAPQRRRGVPNGVTAYNGDLLLPLLKYILHGSWSICCYRQYLLLSPVSATIARFCYYRYNLLLSVYSSNIGYHYYPGRFKFRNGMMNSHSLFFLGWTLWWDFWAPRKAYRKINLVVLPAYKK